MVIFYVPLAALLVTRGKRVDLALMSIMIFHFIITNAYRISGEG